MRLQVFLSHNGVCSRRDAMKVVSEGHVSVNGEVVREPSTPVDPDRDKIMVDGQRIQRKQYDYILLNKPAGYVTTTEDRHAEQIVLDLLPSKYRHVRPVGRLDKETEGLLFLTNDGDLTHRLTHPKFNIDKTYFVRILGQLAPEIRTKLEKGMKIEGEMTLPAKISEVHRNSKHTEFLMTIHEGKKRQIRVMLAACKRKVIYLRRLNHGPLKLGDLRKGGWRALTDAEVFELKKL